MISPIRQRLKYILSDFISANVALVLFNVIRYYTLQQKNFGYETLSLFLFSDSLIIEQIIIPVILLLIYYLSGYYNKPFQKSRIQELLTTIISSIIASLLIYFALLTDDLTKLRTTNYELFIYLFLDLLVSTYILRILITSKALSKIKSKEWSFNVLIIGTSENAVKIGKSFSNSQSNNGYNVIGYVNLPNEEFQTNIPRSIIYDFNDIEKICKEHNVKEIIIIPNIEREKTILSLLNRLFPLNIPIKISADTLSILTSKIRLQNIYEEPFIDITNADISESTKNIKRILDIIFSLIALLILIIPMIIIAILIKKDSKGPVIFNQERIGYRQKPFNIYKFRTMRIDAESEGPKLSSPEDNRITKLGRILRKYRIDELPQFWNVLCGDMSMVGPRPERAFFIKQIVEKAPYYSLIHQVRPGITSWGMVKYGYACNVDEMIRRLKYDLIYLENMSIIVDMKILIYTIKTVLTGRGM